MGDPTFEIVRVSRSCDLCFDDFCRCCFRTRSDMIPSLQRPQLACSSEACRCWLGACRLLKSRLQRSQVIIFGVSPDVLGEPAAVAKRSSTLFLSCAFIANTHPFDSCKCLCADLVREGLRYCSQTTLRRFVSSRCRWARLENGPLGGQLWLPYGLASQCK